MAINLVKGENVRLNMEVFHVGLGWDVNEGASQYDFDLDVSAFMLEQNKKLVSDDYLVFYNSECRIKPEKPQELIRCNTETGAPFNGNKEMRQKSRPVDPELAVIGSIDDENGETSEDGDDETMDINLGLVRAEVQEILICVSIHKWGERKQNFGQVERSYVRLYKPGQVEGEGEYIYDLTEDFSACASVEFCRLYRHNSEWKIQALGIGHKGGLEELVSKYQ